MKIALISDIHGNLPALESVLEDIHRQKADKIICLGDIMGKGPSSKETVDLCRNFCDFVVQGNWDAGLFNAYNVLQQNGATAISESSLWYIDDAGTQRIEYLGSLPHCAEIYLSGKLIRLFHAHPVSFNRYFSDSPLEQRLELFGAGENSKTERQSDVAVYADIHTPYLQMIDGKMLLNTGSVGNPLDITQASYVLLEGEESSDSAGFHVQFVRLPYDIDRAVTLAKNSSVPDLNGYLSEITTAVYFKRH